MVTMTSSELRRRADDIAKKCRHHLRGSDIAFAFHVCQQCLTNALTTVQLEDGKACKAMMKAKIAACVTDAKEEEHEACARRVELITKDEIRLHMGELTRQEMRPLFAALGWIATVIRERGKDA